MRLLVTLDFPPAVGGIQRYLHGIVSHIYEAGDVVLVADQVGRSADDGELVATVKRCGMGRAQTGNKVHLLAVVLPYLLLCLRNGDRLCVECGNIYAALVPWLVSRVIRRPYRIYTYGTELIALKRSSMRIRLLKRVLNGADLVYALGGYTEKLVRDVGFGGRVEVVRPRIELPRGPGPAERGSGRFRILSVGRLVPHKGHRELVQAMTPVLREQDWELVIVGSGSEYGALERLVQGLGLDDLVTLKSGLSNDLLDHEFRLADVFVFPSRETSIGTEGFGMVLLEAMAHRLPVVASRIGGAPEVLDQGKCGVLVEPGDAAAVVLGVRMLHEDPDLARGLAMGAWQRLIDNYVWQ